MTRRFSACLALLAAFPLAFAAGQAAAQERAPVSFEQNIRVNDQLLQRFAQAHARVQQIDARTATLLEQAESDDERMEILVRASTDRATAMRSTGLALEEYNLISVHVNADASLRADIEQRVAAAGN